MAASDDPATLSPLAPEHFPDMPPVSGVRLATTGSGMKYRGRDDVLLAAFDAGTSVAGVFTRSGTAAAPVAWCRRALRDGNGEARGLLVNAGNANAFTGRAGVDSVNRTVKAVADLLGCPPDRVLVASTGVIGEPLPDDRLRDRLPALHRELGSASLETAAKAIMTTDTFAKGASASLLMDDREITLTGIAKGSGMIAPDMATMLSFVFTDAVIGHDVLQPMLADVTGRTFNCITVDSDTSTNDSLLLFATGAAGNRPIVTTDDPRLAAFEEALEQVCRELAQQIVRDGEGAEKFITVTMTGAEDDGVAHRLALAVANSPLVKTAIAGEDANWGRIVMAIGKAGEALDHNRVRIDIGGVPVADNGRAVDGYDETPVAAHMAGREIAIAVDIGVGRGQATVWTCDLTHGYISINADYRS